MASSPRKIQAARANGAKSHGPKTAEGKQIASLNAVTHGLTASIVVLQNESEEQYQADLRDYLDHFRPQGKPETDLVHQLAAAHWRLTRYAGVESGILERKMDDQASWVDGKYDEIPENYRLAIAFEALSGRNGSMGLLNRYQARLHREYQRLLKTLIELQAARQAREVKLRNEPKTASNQPVTQQEITEAWTKLPNGTPAQSAGDGVQPRAPTGQTAAG
jgi:hypothetical protein